MSKCIYIVSADTLIGEKIKLFLAREGCSVQIFDSGAKLYEAFLRKNSDIIIFDIATPGNDGFVLCAKIRQLSAVPMILLADQDSDENYVLGISLGIDAYLTKPFSPIKLIAHIRTLLIKTELQKINHLNHTSLNHTGPGHASLLSAHPLKPVKYVNELKYADIAIYPDRRTAYCGSHEIRLTNIEYRMLSFMIENQARAMSRVELQQAVWGNKPVGARATDDVVKRIRKKLTTRESDTSIEVVWGYGFRLTKNNDALLENAM